MYIKNRVELDLKCKCIDKKYCYNYCSGIKKCEQFKKIKGK